MRKMLSFSFGALVALALGFGAGQAFAAPSQTASSSETCDDMLCNTDCITWGYDGGFCDSISGECTCFDL